MAMLRLRNRDDSKFARAVLQHRGFSAGAVDLYEIRCIARHDFIVLIAHVKHCVHASQSPQQRGAAVVKAHRLPLKLQSMCQWRLPFSFSCGIARGAASINKRARLCAAARARTCSSCANKRPFMLMSGGLANLNAASAMATSRVTDSTLSLKL